MKYKELITESIVKGLSDPRFEQYCNDAVALLKSHLMINMDIEIRFTPTSKYDDSQTGACVAGGKSPTKAIIYINDTRATNNNEKIKTLCHEMIHAHQFSRGDLVVTGIYNQFDPPRFSGTWKGEPFKCKYSKTRPWEQEAHYNEHKLYDFVIDKLKNPIFESGD